MKNTVLKIFMKMSKEYIAEEILDKQLFNMKGHELLELFSHAFSLSKPSSKPKDMSDFIVGIRGLAVFLKCGTTKAQQLKNSGVLDECIHYVGKKVYFKKEKLLQIVSSKNFQKQC